MSCGPNTQYWSLIGGCSVILICDWCRGEGCQQGGQECSNQCSSVPVEDCSAPSSQPVCVTVRTGILSSDWSMWPEY